MQITVSWGGEEVAVQLDATCRTLAALKKLLQDALPDVDVKKVRLEVDGQQLTTNDGVCGLDADSVVTLSATVAARAAATLREEGCDVDLAGFLEAAREGDVRRCGLYLDADVTGTPNRDGPLHIACHHNHVDVVRLLLDRGAAIDKKNRQGDTPLHKACLYNRVFVATILLDRGAAIDEKSDNGGTPLHKACHQNDVEIAALLIQRNCAIDARNVVGYTPLHLACHLGNLEVATHLLDRGAAIEERSGKGNTPLHTVCLQNRVAIAVLLLFRGAVMTAKTTPGNTPLRIACKYRHIEIVGLLLDGGCPVEEADQATAKERGDSELIALLAGAKARQLAAPPALRRRLGE